MSRSSICSVRSADISWLQCSEQNVGFAPQRYDSWASQSTCPTDIVWIVIPVRKYIQTRQEACMCSTYKGITCRSIKYSILFKIINDWFLWEEIFWLVSGMDKARCDYFLQKAKMQNTYTYVSCYVQYMLPVSAVVVPRFAYFWTIPQSSDTAEGPVFELKFIGTMLILADTDVFSWHQCIVKQSGIHHWPLIICCVSLILHRLHLHVVFLCNTCFLWWDVELRQWYLRSCMPFLACNEMQWNPADS